MINKFLNAKHWQLFIPTFVLPILLQFIFMGVLVSGFASEDNFDMEFVFIVFKIFPIFMILISAVYFGWFWSIAVGLDKEIPEDLKLNLGRFKLLFGFALAYIILISLVVGFLFPVLFTMIGAPSGIFGVIFILHIFAMFCMFHNLYFVAKTIKTAELQREVSFGDFVGEFFLLWFFPIGIWIVQPQINKIVAEDDSFI